MVYYGKYGITERCHGVSVFVAKRPMFCNRCVVSTIPKDYCRKYRLKYDRGVWNNKDSIRRRIDPLNIDTGGVQPPRLLNPPKTTLKRKMHNRKKQYSAIRHIPINKAMFGVMSNYDQYAVALDKVLSNMDTIRRKNRR